MLLQVTTMDGIPVLTIDAVTPEEQAHLQATLEDLERTQKVLLGTGTVGPHISCGATSQSNDDDVGDLVCSSLSVHLALGGAKPVYP